VLRQGGGEVKTETRLILYTNDARLLALAEFPLYITDWKLESKSQQEVKLVAVYEDISITSHLLHRIQSTGENVPAFSIDKKISAIPPTFTPKIYVLTCISDEARFLTFFKVTLHPSYTLDESHLEVVEKNKFLWAKGRSLFGDVVDRNPVMKQYSPRNRSPSILMLKSVDGSPEEAMKLDLLWDVWDQIIQGGNEYARTPICEVVERKEVKRSLWEYRPLRRG
jgi:hypothetical protein